MVRKSRALFAWGVVVLTLGLVLFGALAVASRLHGGRTDVSVGSSVFSSAVVTSEADQERGLGGTDSLGDRDGMLFVFDTDGPHPIWMKDMNYPIDIVWLSASKEVVTVTSDVSPQTYPKLFAAQKPARYVLEIPAGAAARSGITRGIVASFDVR